MRKRLWFDLPAVLGLAEHAMSCQHFRGFGVYRAEACLLVETAGAGRIGSNGASDQPAPPWLAASHVDGDAEQRWDRPTAAYYLRLTHPDSDGDHGPEQTLLELLRASRDAAWFTVDVEDDETARYAIRASRPVDDVPGGATWLPARIRTDQLGPYPGQIAYGYHRPGGALFARFSRDVAWWIALDWRHLPADKRPAEAIRVDGEQVMRVHHAGTGQEHVEPLAASDGWWRIDGDACPWTVTDDDGDARTGTPELSETLGPDGERCGVCHAINAFDHHELPSMVGYGLDTSIRCRRCGSTESTDPMFGAHTHRASWPPPRDRQDEIDRQDPAAHPPRP